MKNFKERNKINLMKESESILFLQVLAHLFFLIFRKKYSAITEILFYKMSPNAVYKLEGDVENILRSHNYIGKHRRKCNPNGIKRHKDSKSTKQNVV